MPRSDRPCRRSTHTSMRSFGNEVNTFRVGKPRIFGPPSRDFQRCWALPMGVTLDAATSDRAAAMAASRSSVAC